MKPSSKNRVLTQRRGTTLVELLIVIAIIGLLMQMLLPAVQASRETARRQQCANHLHQIGVAWQLHHDAHKFFPTGGWGWKWTGDPDRGFGVKQPGGWAYNLLPFVEESATHDLGRGAPADQKAQKAYQALQSPVELFYCPSRRRAGAFFIFPDFYSYNAQFAAPFHVARSDYAASCGDLEDIDGTHGAGPSTLQEGDSTFPWPNAAKFTGISFVRSKVSMKDVTDGTTHTYMVGEKWISPMNYETGLDRGDNEYYTVGFDNDTYRTTHIRFPPASDGQGGPDESFAFGSAHPSVWQVVFVDGSLQAISYEIDPEQHRRQGTRSEGK